MAWTIEEKILATLERLTVANERAAVAIEKYNDSACYWRDQAEKAKVEGLRRAEEKVLKHHEDCLRCNTADDILKAIRAEREKVERG